VKILALYAEDYPWDIRVQKILTSLTGDNHEVHLLCRNLKCSPSTEIVDDFTCHRVLPPKVPALLQSILSIPAYFNPIWHCALNKKVKELKPDLLIVRDLPMSPLAIKIAHNNNIPCVVDMAENHPEMWRQVCENDPWRLPSLILKNPALGKRLEKKTVVTADHILVVVDEMRDYLISIGANHKQVHIVSNTPIAIPAIASATENDNPKFLDIVFTGFITNRRGLEFVIRAIANMGNVTPRPRLHIAGSGPDESRLKKLSQKLNLEEQVVWHGWVEHKKLNEVINSCHVGIIPHPKNGHTDHTIPNKIFDYMASSLPVIVTNARPMERICNTHNCGLVFEDKNQKDFTQCIIKLSDPELRRQLAINGYNAVNEHYQWHMDFDVLKTVINGQVDRELQEK